MSRHPATRASAGAPYRPTSLDFINWPNPVEPQSVSSRHPLDSTQSLTSGAGANAQDRRLPLLDSQDHAERPSKRRKSGEAQSLDLPKLPVRQRNTRFRIPPTLSGLHQPPPNAGLLPSISVGKPVDARGHEASKPHSSETIEAAVEDSPHASSRKTQPSQTFKAKRKRWTDEETADLLKGVARFGVGKWTKILNCPDYSFERRTAIDLKDRFRVCCPDEYLGGMAPRRRKTLDGNHSSDRPTPKLDRMSTSDLRELGINQPFAQNARRKRRVYTDIEDAALLRGFEKHGNSWSAIAHDADLGLGHRKPTDLRDRLRTRFPSIYVKAGLAPRPDGFGKPARRVEAAEPSASGPPEKSPESVLQAASESIAPGASQERPVGQGSGRPGPRALALPTTSFYEYDDVFLDVLDEQGEAFGTHERITLDRGILDWPSDVPRPPPPRTERLDQELGDGWLKTTRPPAQPAVRSSPPSVSRIPGSSTNTALPSVASITARSTGLAEGEQLDLPSLISFGGLDSAGRNSSQFLGLDELLS